MDTNNQRPANPGGEAAMETGDWRAQLPPDARQKILNKIIVTLKKYLPSSSQEELEKLKNVAGRFEEKTYSMATDQKDYLRKISWKMLTFEAKYKNSLPNRLPTNVVGSTSKPQDPGVQVNNQGQSLPVPLSVNQSQECQHLVSQNMQNNMASSGVQSSAGLPSALATVTSLNKSPVSSVVGQNPNMQNVSGILLNSVGNSMRQGVPTNIFANLGKMPVRQQVSPQQHQQPSQNSQHLYQQLMKQKFQRGNLPQMLMKQQQQSSELTNFHFVGFLKRQQEEPMLQTQQQQQQFQQCHEQQQLMKQEMLQLQQQQQQLKQQLKHQLPAQMQIQQMPQLRQKTDANQLKIGQSMGVKPGVFQQHLSSSQLAGNPHQQTKSGGSFPISMPQMLPAASFQLPQHSSPQVDQQNLLSSLKNTGTPLQSGNSPFIVPSLSTLLAPSPALGDSEKPMPGISSLSNSRNVGHQQTIAGQTIAASPAIGTPNIPASRLLAEFTGSDGAHGITALTAISSKSNVTEQPFERLVKAVKPTSPEELGASVSNIGSKVCMMDRIVGPASGDGSRAAVGEELLAIRNLHLRKRNFITQDGTSDTRKMQRYINAMPLDVASSAGSMSDSYKQLTGPEASDLESTATSSKKRPRIGANHALLEEIWEINQRLISTVVNVSVQDVNHNATAAVVAEGGEGTIVKCSFSTVALSPSLKSLYASSEVSPIQPLRLLVPSNYPNCSPILLDKLPVEVSSIDHDDLSVKARLRFSASLRRLSLPMSLSDIVRTWDVCARAVISEYAQQHGGGSFSLKYGVWERLSGA